VLAVPDLLKIYMQPAVVASPEHRSKPAEPVRGFPTNTPVGTAGTALTEATVDRGGNQRCSWRRYRRASRSTSCGLGGVFGRGGRFRCSRNSRRLGAAGPAGIDRRDDRKYKDFYVFRSQFVPEDGEQPVSNTHNLCVLPKDAIAWWFAGCRNLFRERERFAEYAELGNFGVRVVMSYQPNTLAQQFTVDVLYGCGVLRNACGVQVNT